MDARGLTTECAQQVNTIYAWSKLLEAGRLDGTLRTRALEIIQQSAVRLADKILAKAERA